MIKSSHSDKINGERTSHLEAVNRATIQALRLVLEMGRQGVSLNRIDKPEIILQEVQDKIDRLIPWEAAAFYLMDDQDADLSMVLCTPSKAAPRIKAIFERLVEERILSLVLRRSDHYFAGGDDSEVLIHAMNTVSRCRGVFLGIPQQPRKAIHDTSLAIFSIMMQSAAQTLESYELYRIIREVNSELEDKIKRLESEMAERKRVQRSLIDSRHMLHLVMDTIPQGIFWKDTQSVYLGCNRHYACLLDLEKPENILGKSDGDLSWRKKEAARHRDVDLHVMREKKAQLALTDRIVRADGSEAWVETDVVPLKDANGAIIGVLGCTQDITERKRYQERLTHMALHDPLTGLPNRALLLERLERAIERGRRRNNYHFAVLMLDLDRFKQINDTMGHQIGDQILVRQGRRIGECLRGMDTVSRTGGDEFVVLLEELNSPREAVVIARRLFHEIKRVEVVDDTELFITASGGLLIKTKSYLSADDLLRDAEIALQSAMEKGGAGFKVFTTSMLQRFMHAASLEHDLRRGLAHNEFVLQYQPIYTLNGCVLIGFEALARWNHPVRGLISPVEFIPVAERTGIIKELGDWVLQTACLTMSEWRTRFPKARDLFMSVNLSGRQLAQPNLAATVLQVLQETGLSAASLKLEITESAIMENADLALITLRELKRLGISLAIDDFGTGYSSLSYLHRFPVDTLKIDRSFIAALDNHDGQQITQAMMALAHSLKLTVVAEGVEKDLQIDSLRGMSCQCVQGFFFSRPLDALAIHELLA
ncbi:MAG TPA: EAL domain-containing protein [Desulfonatronum sp.]|nr:EAL domain-containing protein [Desulfonatronum sp.]